MQHKQSAGVEAPVTAASVRGCQPLSKWQGGSWEPEFMLAESKVTFLSGLSLYKWHEREKEKERRREREELHKNSQ